LSLHSISTFGRDLTAQVVLESQIFGPRVPRVPKSRASTNITIIEDALGYLISSTGGTGSGDSDQIIIPAQSFLSHVASGGLPSGVAGGGLKGSYPNPEVIPERIVDGITPYLPHPQRQKEIRAGTNVTVTEDARGYIVSGAVSSPPDSDQSILSSLIFTPHTAIPSSLPGNSGLLTVGPTLSRELLQRQGTSLIGAPYPPEEPIVWTSIVNATATFNTLAATGLSGLAISAQSLMSRDGYTEYQAYAGPAYTAIGLSNLATTYGAFGDIQFCIMAGLSAGKKVIIYESGGLIGVFRPWAAGDRLRVSIEDGLVRYRHNGTLLYTSGVTPTYPLRSFAFLYDVGEQMTAAVISNWPRDPAYSDQILSVESFLPHPVKQRGVRAGANVTVTEDALGYVVAASSGSPGDSDQSLLPGQSFTRHPPLVPEVQAGTGVTIVQNARGPVISASGGAGDSDQAIIPSLLFTPPQQRTVAAWLDLFTSTMRGVVPGSGGGVANFLRADGTWASPGASSVPDLVASKHLPGNITVAADTASYVTRYVEIAAGITVELAANSDLEIG
jgi:hypothetical protein